MRIAEFSVRNSQFTFIIFCFVMALGAGSLHNMPRAEDPKFTPPGYSIVIVYPGATPSEIEDKIGDPLEARLGALENIDRMRSVAFSGVLLTTIEFKHGQDADRKYEEVIRETNALRAELPDEIYELTVKRFSSSDVAILQGAILSENASWTELRREAERLEEALEKIPGIKAADTYGFPKREARIALNLPKMAAEGIGVDRVLGALHSENLSIPGGAVHLGERQFFVETSGNYASLDEVRNTVVFANGGKIIYLKDLAAVDWAYEEPRHLIRLNGVRCVWVTARMKDEQNIFTVGDAVNKTVSAWRLGLPRSMDYAKVFDQNDSVRKRLIRFTKDFGIAILLVLLTLLPLGWRAALVVMISIPLSLSLGLFALDQLGYSLNQLSIVGLIISLGILVDDSIVVVENIERWLREGHSKREAAILATRQIGLAVLGCTATLVLAFLPLVFLPEASGDFIRSLPMAVVTTVLASLFVSLTIVPFLSSRLLSGHHDPRGNVFLRGMKWVISKTYAQALHKGLQFPRTTLVIALGIFVGALALASRTGFTVFPSSERPMFYIDINLAEGSNFEKTDRVTHTVDSILQEYVMPGFNERFLFGNDSINPRYDRRSLPEGGSSGKGLITWYATNIGHGNPRVYYNVIREIERPTYAQVFVQLLDRTPPPVKIALIDELRARFKAVPGAVINVKNFEQGPPIEAPITIRVFGENLDTLRGLSSKVENIIASTEGTMYVDNPLANIQTDLHIKINKEKAATLGIPVAEVDKMVRLAIAGLTIGHFTAQADGEEYGLTVSVPKSGRFPSLDVLNNLYINSLAGTAVPLNQVAEVEFKPSPTFVEHYNKERFTSVTAYVNSNRYAAEVNQGIKQQLAEIRMPSGYHYQVAGEEESAQRSFTGIGPTILITIFGLLAVLILEFRTFRSTIIVLSVIPLGIIGAVLMLLATGYPFSFTVVVGLIALMGIEVKNSILLVDFTNQLRAEGRSLDEAIQEAGEIRFVPILLTSLTAIGGLLPLAIEENPLYSPLAYVLIGGLISSTLLARIVTPVLYKLLAPRIHLV